MKTNNEKWYEDQFKWGCGKKAALFLGITGFVVWRVTWDRR